MFAIGEEHLRPCRSEWLPKRSKRVIETPWLRAAKRLSWRKDHRWLRLLALGKLRDPVQFWNKLEHLSPYTAKPPEDVRTLLESSFPSARQEYLLKRRIAGLGSLGHPRNSRLVQMAGSVHRPGSEGDPAFGMGLGQEGLFPWKFIAKSWCSARFACRIPFAFHGRWWCGVWHPTARELSSLPCRRIATRRGLLYSMGWETANMHFSTPQATAKLQHDLASRAGPMAPQSLKGHAGGNQERLAKWQSDWKRSAPR